MGKLSVGAQGLGGTRELEDSVAIAEQDEGKKQEAKAPICCLVTKYKVHRVGCNAYSCATRALNVHATHR
jgi:hypothetical protein